MQPQQFVALRLRAGWRWCDPHRRGNLQWRRRLCHPGRRRNQTRGNRGPACGRADVTQRNRINRIVGREGEATSADQPKESDRAQQPASLASAPRPRLPNRLRRIPANVDIGIVLRGRHDVGPSHERRSGIESLARHAAGHPGDPVAVLIVSRIDGAGANTAPFRVPSWAVLRWRGTSRRPLRPGRDGPLRVAVSTARGSGRCEHLRLPRQCQVAPRY